MQVKEIDIDTGKNLGLWNLQKKIQNLIFRWTYHSDLLYLPFTNKLQRKKEIFECFKLLAVFDHLVCSLVGDFRFLLDKQNWVYCVTLPKHLPLSQLVLLHLSTESVHRWIQSISCNIHLCVCMFICPLYVTF